MSIRIPITRQHDGRESLREKKSWREGAMRASERVRERERSREREGEGGNAILVS